MDSSSSYDRRVAVISGLEVLDAGDGKIDVRRGFLLALLNTTPVIDGVPTDDLEDRVNVDEAHHNRGTSEGQQVPQREASNEGEYLHSRPERPQQGREASIQSDVSNGKDDNCQHRREVNSSEPNTIPTTRIWQTQKLEGDCLPGGLVARLAAAPKLRPVLMVRASL